MISSEMITRLISAGLTKQQANSVTADVAVNVCMSEEGKYLIAEAKNQVSEMQTVVNDLKRQYRELENKIGKINEVLTAVLEAREEYGAITEEKARNTVALYAALLNMNKKSGASDDECISNAGYVTYAYLGGQARRITDWKERDE